MLHNDSREFDISPRPSHAHKNPSVSTLSSRLLHVSVLLISTNIDLSKNRLHNEPRGSHARNFPTDMMGTTHEAMTGAILGTIVEVALDAFAGDVSGALAGHSLLA